MKKVTIIQRILPHYRISFFERLFEKLQARNIALQLIYGQEYPGTVPRTFDLDRTWSHRVNNKYIRLPGAKVIWQPCIKTLRNSDLIILEHSNQLLLNYPLVLRLLRRNARLAYWGHGKNMQALGKKRFREIIKKWTTTRVDWWFTYTELGRDLVRGFGYPADRITVVQNSIDTRVLADAIDSVDEVVINRIKQRLGITGDNVCIFCGGMYPDKWLDFLLRACQKIKERIPDFHMLFIGSGPEEEKVKKAEEQFSWVHCVGPVYDGDRAPYFVMSKAALMPGLVGLGIIDSFVSGVPLFTTRNSIHSPEVQYLEDRINGIMTECSENSFASAVIGYLESSDLQLELKEGCAVSAATFTLDNMVNNYAEGIERALVV